MEIKELVATNVFKFYISDFTISALAVLKNLVTKTNTVDSYLYCNAATFDYLYDSLQGFKTCLDTKNYDHKIFGMYIKQDSTLPFKEILIGAKLSEDYSTSILIDINTHSLGSDFTCDLFSRLTLKSLPVN